MLKTFLSLLCIIAVSSSFSQNISGTWYGFQISRDKGQSKEYRITVDFVVNADSITGTMALKADEKGTITSKFSGNYDPRTKTYYLREVGVLNQGLNEKEFSLCEYALKVDNEVIKGKGRAMNKGYDYLDIRLSRQSSY